MKELKVVDIVTDREKLKERTEEVDIVSDKKHISDIVARLKDTILSKNLTALSAPEIGENARIFCVNFSGDIRTFINPVIIGVEGFKLSREADSCDSKEYIVPRNEEITLAYQTLVKAADSNKFTSAAASEIQRMINLLDGLLVSDFGLEITAEFDAATEKEKDEVLSLYMKHLKNLNMQIKEDMKDNKLLNDTYKAIEFMESVAKGETKLEKPEPKLNRKQRRDLKKALKKVAAETKKKK